MKPQKEISFKVNIWDIIDVDILNNMVDKKLKKTVYEIDYQELLDLGKGDFLIKATYEED